MYAIRTDAFFVHKGSTKKEFEQFIAAYSYYPVITVGNDFKASHITDALRKGNLVPRIYLARSDELLSRHDRKSLYDVSYGNLVESDELNNLLEETESIGAMGLLPRDGVYEANRWRSVLWKHSRLLRLPRV